MRYPNFARRGDTMRLPDGRELKICRVRPHSLSSLHDLYVCTDGARTYFVSELWRRAAGATIKSR